MPPLDELLNKNYFLLNTQITLGTLIVYIGYLLFAVVLLYSTRKPVQHLIRSNIQSLNTAMKVRP